jgi:hypothetical protein
MNSLMSHGDVQRRLLLFCLSGAAVFVWLWGGLALAGPAPAPTWVVRYNGPANGGDTGRAIVTDRQGNIYVTGDSKGAGTINYDMATVKYRPNGGQAWAARYDGASGNSQDTASAVAVDSQGYVYITGHSERWVGQTTWDLTTVKYDPFGNEVWVARYNSGLYNGSGCHGHALAVDRDGNVYVTGESGTDYPSWSYPVIIKYNPAGEQQWARLNDRMSPYGTGGRALVLGQDGYVYITGTDLNGSSNYDMVTIKYDFAGEAQWTSRYNGPDNKNDKGAALAVDLLGNVYVTGESEGKTSGSDLLTVKYGPGGNQLWAATYNGPADGDDRGVSLALDRAGFIYVTGRSPGVGTGTNIATLKYSPAGDRLWAVRYSGPAGMGDVPSGLQVDDRGVYVAGSTWYPGGLTDYLTLKYTHTGQLEWAAFYNGTSNGGDQATALALDRDGNLFVTGSSQGTGSGYDYATLKYLRPGYVAWELLLE